MSSLTRIALLCLVSLASVDTFSLVSGNVINQINHQIQHDAHAVNNAIRQDVRADNREIHQINSVNRFDNRLNNQILNNQLYNSQLYNSQIIANTQPLVQPISTAAYVTPQVQYTDPGVQYAQVPQVNYGANVQLAQTQYSQYAAQPVVQSVVQPSYGVNYAALAQTTVQPQVEIPSYQPGVVVGQNYGQNYVGQNYVGQLGYNANYVNPIGVGFNNGQYALQHQLNRDARLAGGIGGGNFNNINRAAGPAFQNRAAGPALQAARPAGGMQARPAGGIRRSASVADAIDADDDESQSQSESESGDLQSKEEMLNEVDHNIQVDEEKLKSLADMDQEDEDHEQHPEHHRHHEHHQDEDEDEGIVVKVSVHVGKKLAWMKRNLAKNASRMF